VLDEFAQGLHPLLVIEAPPGHGKSEAVSRNLPAYLLGKFPSTRIIACSYTGDLARDMNRDVQRIIETEAYHDIFPATRLASKGNRTQEGQERRNTDTFDVVGHRGIYKAAGVGMGITGRRFDFGIIDDPIKDRETANSATMREAIWRWFTGVFLTRRSREGRVLLTATRWHEDDLTGRIRQRENLFGKLSILTLPALATPRRQHSDDPRQVDEALWPWFKSAAQLKEDREIEPRDFDALYQQNPRPEGGTEWPESFFGSHIWFEEWPRDILFWVLACDPSKGKDAKAGDFSAFVELALTRDGQIWIDAHLERVHLSLICERIVQLYMARRHAAIAIETNQFQEMLAVMLGTIAKERKLVFPMFGINNALKKEVRIRRIGPYLAQRKLRFKAKSHGTRQLVQQLRDFPVGEHDDGPDGLEMGLRMLMSLLGKKHEKGRPMPVAA